MSSSIGCKRTPARNAQGRRVHLNCVERTSRAAEPDWVSSPRLSQSSPSRLERRLAEIERPGLRHDPRRARRLFLARASLSRRRQERGLPLSRARARNIPACLPTSASTFPWCAGYFDTADRIARDVGDAIPPSEHLLVPSEERDEKLWSTGNGGERRAERPVGHVSTPDPARPAARRRGRP